MKAHRRLWMAVPAVMLAFALPLAAQEGRGRSASEARRDSWQKVDQIFEAMALKPGAAVADVGAGGGYFTSRLSRAVGDGGHVYAVDISRETVSRLRERVASEELANVDVIQGAADDPRLPASTLDAVLIVNAYHEMTEHQAMLAKLKAALKPAGRLVIVEPLAPSHRTSPREVQTRNHEIAADFVKEDAREAGFTHVLLQDPFTKRLEGADGDEEWLLVLTPATAATDAAAAWSSKNEAWKAPELRIAVDEFKRLTASKSVLILDVRDRNSFRNGHLPDAVLMTPEDLETPAALATLAKEKRPIVTYCS